MGPQRPPRREVVTISSDEDENPPLPSDPSEEEQPAKPAKQSTGKLKPVKKSDKTQPPVSASPKQTQSSQRSPAKSKTSKAKSKTAVKEPPKPNAKPIYSFFNSATQRLRDSQPSASPEKNSTPQEEPETIHDDTDDGEGSGLQFSKGSSTALALRKRKIQHSTSFENDTGLPPPTSQKFLKATNGERVPSFSVINEDKRPWTDRFAPNDLTELAVHKRKVADVRQWLEMTLSGQRQRVLVLKGAAGTGKTTTIRLLAKDMDLEVIEWKNPGGVETTGEGSVSAAGQFDEFVGRAGRSGGLTFALDDDDEKHASDVRSIDDDLPAHERRQLLLVEEFPNTFSRSSSTLQSFRSAISQYLATPTLTASKPKPIVMIISETLLSTNTALADSFTAHRLLGPELCNHPYLDMIEFNAIALTFLQKALETIVLKEARKSGRRKTPGPQVLKRLAESGDIRSAVSSLEFLCLRGDDGDAWSSRITFTKSKKSKSDPPLTQAEEEALKLISNRESTLGIFHAVGKVVYNKRVDATSIPHPPPWLPQHRRNKISENNVDELIDELGTDTSTFVAALHENYAFSCSSSSAEDTLDSMVGCIDNISDADLLSVDRFSFGTRAYSGSATDSLRQDEMGFQVSVRGLWFNLPQKVNRGVPADRKGPDAFRMFYPASLRLWKKREEVEGILELLATKVQAGGLNSALFARDEPSQSPAHGVENWKRNTNLDSAPANQESVDGSGKRTDSARMELLLDRLPYMAQIVDSRKTSSKIVEQLHAITRIRGSALVDENDEADLEETADINQEQWATDRPDTEVNVKPRSTKPKSKTQQGKATDGGGLGIPVETRVEKLVLEDDDIVDD